MKKALSLILILLMLSSLCGCSKAIIYEEEKTIHQWLTQRTQGYTQITPSRMMTLYKEEDGFTLRIDTGSDMAPRITVINDKENQTILDKVMLTVTESARVYANATHASTFYDPYRNGYTEALKIYQKDEKNFRIFFWLYGSNTDFYPIPALLTAEQYQQMLPIVDQYTEEMRLESEEAGETPVNYTADFMSIYEGKYFSDKAENPDGAIYYEYKGTESEYLSVYRSLFAQLGLTEQDWRQSFEDLGYTGQKLDLHIVYCDVTVEEDKICFDLVTSDAYSSPLLKSREPNFTYTFCAALSPHDYIDIELK